MEPWCRKNLQYRTVGVDTIPDAILQAIELNGTCGIDSQMQKPNYNIEICDALRRGFPNSNCIGFPIPAAHRVH